MWAKVLVASVPAAIVGIGFDKVLEKLTNKDIDGTAALCEEFGIVTPAAVAKKAIPLCNIVYEDGKENVIKRLSI